MTQSTSQISQPAIHGSRNVSATDIIRTRLQQGSARRREATAKRQAEHRNRLRERGLVALGLSIHPESRDNLNRLVQNGKFGSTQRQVLETAIETLALKAMTANDWNRLQGRPLLGNQHS